MVIFTNGELCGDGSNQHPLENGHIPKYKARKVSAIRDFPPRCGPNFVQINGKTEENGVGGVTEVVNLLEAEGGGDSKMANLMEVEGVKTSEMSEVAKICEVEVSEIGNVLDSGGIKISIIEDEGQSHEAVNIDMDVREAESLDELVEKVAACANHVEKMLTGIGPPKIQLHNEVDGQSQESVDNLIEAKNAEHVDALMGQVATEDGSSNNPVELMTETILVGADLLNKMKSSSMETGDQTMSKEINEVEGFSLIQYSGVKEKKYMLDAGASGEEVPLPGHSESSSSFYGRINPDISFRLKDKCRRRRVSAVRDFPPHCGTNIQLPTEEEKHMGVLVGGCLKNSEKVEVEPHSTMSGNGSGETLGKTPVTSNKERRAGIDEVHVNRKTNETFNNDVGEGPLKKKLSGNVRTIASREVMESTVEGGLIDFEECNRRLKESNIKKTEPRQYVPGLGAMAKATIDNGTEDTGGRVREETVNHSLYSNDEVRAQCQDSSSGNELQREVVQGLMAAPYGTEDTGGRFGKDTVNHSLDSNDEVRAQCRDSSSGNELQREVIHGLMAAPYGNEDTGGQVGKETVNHSLDSNDEVRAQCQDSSSGNELQREVVHGLMAAPYCPWRKGKVPLDNSDSGKSRGNMKHEKRKQKSEAVSLNSNLKAECSLGLLKKTTVTPDSFITESPGSATFMESEDHGFFDECLSEVTPISMFKPLLDNSVENSAEPVCKEMILYNDPVKPADEVDKEIAVHDSNNLNRRRSGGKSWKQSISSRKKFKAVATKSTPKAKFSGGLVKNQKKVPLSKYKDVSSSALIRTDDEGNGRDGDLPIDHPSYHKQEDFDVRLPPFGPNSSSHGDARNKVRETLRLFHTICRKLLQKEEANSKPEEDGKSKRNRIDLLTAKIIKGKGKEVNTEKQVLGQVPGVEVGDEFQYRVELAVVGIHRLYQAGIDWMKVNGVPVASSIVASGAYADDMENADVLIYSGQGGNIVGKSKQPEDQKLERGNLALSNSIKSRTPVRVVRGWKETKALEPLDSRPKTVTTYVYDGLYTVENYWTETGIHGKMVFMFELRRIPGQPELAWKELRKSSKSKTRPGVCVPDISGGQEPFPICAVNTLDDDKPPPFNYTSKMLYPDWYRPITPPGCDCAGRCTDSSKCKCAVRNGGEIPYNRNGAIVEVKPLVYECGPHCKCPPSCYNRVTQRGLKFKLEIFKTESRGWGIRSFTSIPSGSFICEYAGELLEDKEAEKRVGNDEYLFDIGQNYSDSSINPEEQAMSVEIMEEGGYTIDAAQYGNVGRFINHSCSPNLYAQNVIYDHDDKKMPHVMLFAAENIPPLQELTYHYNYALDQVRDSEGNIKIKKCYCGSAECTGRMY